MRSRLGPPRPYDDGRMIVVRSLAPRVEPGWLALRDRWLELPPHPNLIDAIDGEGERLLVRHVAISSTFRPLEERSSRSARQLARWATQLASVFELIVEHVPATDLGLFLAPFLVTDQGNHVRVGFVPAPPQQRVTPQLFVGLLGDLVSTLSVPEPFDEMGAFLRRCLDPAPAGRPQLHVAHRRCVELAGRDSVRTGDELVAWELVEEALGWLELGVRDRARELFLDAAPLGFHQWLIDGGLVASVPPLPTPPSPPATTREVVVDPVAVTAAEHYQRGKRALLARAYHDARDAFETALRLQPTMIEAMLLRREADRAMKGVRETVGVARPMSDGAPSEGGLADLEAKWRSLEQSGSTVDAEEAFRRYVAAVQAASDLRLG